MTALDDSISRHPAGKKRPQEMCQMCADERRIYVHVPGVNGGRYEARRCPECVG